MSNPLIGEAADFRDSRSFKAMRELLPGPSAGRIASVLELTTVAEEELAAAKVRHPAFDFEEADAFVQLVPPTELVPLSDVIYRSHARELLDRMALGDDLGPGTDAECLVATLQCATQHPLNRDGFALADRLYRSVMGDEVTDKLLDGYRGHESHPGAVGDLLYGLRKKVGRLR